MKSDIDLPNDRACESEECNMSSHSHDEESNDELSDEQIDYEVIDYNTCMDEQVAMVMAQAKVFGAFMSLFKCFFCPKALVSGDLVLSFGVFIPLSSINMTFNERFGKEINLLITKANNKVSVDDVYVFCIERAGDIPLEMILDMYRTLKYADQKHIVFISRVVQCKVADAREAAKEFREYKQTDLNLMPVRGEEVLLLSSYICKSDLRIDRSVFRLFLLSSKMFGSFVSRFGKEVERGRD
ncbi:hypothetical protein CWI42_041780 [Ordospora colligata]|uniref:Uncharacterized protein n=1 Tax=Ordospora colligata OC4 TaxID=1354746 RepID=A0A0B2UFW7_9MICR|nr:uncharacterized protein M896_041790 [Ordospora colligata OC4]KHN69981.1 hypothetical protein M896_041790 [Ordospora colligata OC4]TBU16151.1 hypothetical protein CWI41_041780 [Ordospora colligata]TBU16364.1 hypothetical protein CWI40_041780 [Ordospora colligata]TBU19068.1 hypothetical protein CWI42_041780 [Ordospora colligata]